MFAPQERNYLHYNLFVIFLLFLHVQCNEATKTNYGSSANTPHLWLRNNWDKPGSSVVSANNDTVVSSEHSVKAVHSQHPTTELELQDTPAKVNKNDSLLGKQEEGPLPTLLESLNTEDINEAISDNPKDSATESEGDDDGEETVEQLLLASTESAEMAQENATNQLPSAEETVLLTAFVPSSNNTEANNGQLELLMNEASLNSSTNHENVTNGTTEAEDSSAIVPPSTTYMKGVSKPKRPLADTQLIPECGCRRKFFYNFEGLAEFQLNSSCSDEGTHYSPGQKVVSFSLPNPIVPDPTGSRTEMYKVSILENLVRMRHFYPDYSMRVYTDIPLDNNFCRLVCLNTDLFWCDIGNSIGDQSKMLQSTWKFLPLGDPSVELFLSRDLASYITDREAAAVGDWLQLNKTFHIMRDKRRLHNIPIVGGLWGARNDLLEGDAGEKMRTQIISMSKTPRNKGYRPKNFDQDILSRVIFFPHKKDIVAYDSYHCKQWKKYTMVRPFPTKRNHTTSHTVLIDTKLRGAASAAVAAIKKKYKLTKCPIECRPSYGKDWEYC